MASTTGKRIKNRRRDLGIGVQEMADLLGKNRTTVYRYESDAVEDMPYIVLQNLAEILRTTPAYLMGLTDDPTDYSDPELTKDIPLALLHAWQDEGLSDEEIGRRYVAFRDAQEGAWKTENPSPEEDGLTEKQRQLIKLIADLPDDVVSMLLSAAKAYIDNQQPLDAP